MIKKLLLSPLLALTAILGSQAQATPDTAVQNYRCTLAPYMIEVSTQNNQAVAALSSTEKIGSLRQVYVTTAVAQSSGGSRGISYVFKQENIPSLGNYQYVFEKDLQQVLAFLINGNRVKLSSADQTITCQPVKDLYYKNLMQICLTSPQAVPCKNGFTPPALHN